MSIRRDAPDCRDETIVISFGSGSAASTSKILQSPIQKCSVHSGPEVQRPCRNYFKVPSRSAAFIRPEVQRPCRNYFKVPSRSAAFIRVRKCSMSKLFQSPIQKYSVHSGPEVQRPCRNYCKVPSRSAAFIRVRKCSMCITGSIGTGYRAARTVVYDHRRAGGWEPLEGGRGQI
jgi:hypothetical protein